MERITSISKAGLDFLVEVEGLETKAYLDTGGLPTIGIGTTRYPDGTRVAIGDTCTIEEAYFWARHDLASVFKDVDDLTRDDINQHQFDALVSFVYNVGRGQYKGSTLRRLINDNPIDPKIKQAFLMWVKDNGKVIPGLINRRTKEVQLYFS